LPHRAGAWTGQKSSLVISENEAAGFCRHAFPENWRDKLKYIIAALFTLFATPLAQAGALLPGAVQFLCHRTANEDVPENTMESLEQAALLGCNVVEIDLRRSLDGKIVLNHDGMLERLTDGSGEVETSYYADLELRDAGSWMGDRFTGMHIALFEDALRLAREQDIGLILEIKDKGMGADVLQILQHEGMVNRVQFNGEWADLKKLYPRATDAGDGTVWVGPGVTSKGEYADALLLAEVFEAVVAIEPIALAQLYGIPKGAWLSALNA
jgi:hypothetical protein